MLIFKANGQRGSSPVLNDQRGSSGAPRMSNNRTSNGLTEEDQPIVCEVYLVTVYSSSILSQVQTAYFLSKFISQPQVNVLKLSSSIRMCHLYGEKHM